MTPPSAATKTALPGMLSGVRIIETGGELAEYCGLVLAGLGAQVIKVEPPEGCRTRSIGPFYGDVADPERSLYFWSYNRGKTSVSLDLSQPDARQRFERLCLSADVLLDGGSDDVLARAGIDRGLLSSRHPALIRARITPFGEHGPWKDYKASDLIHLALGGVLSNCGYDRSPDGDYDLPPIAPQQWHAYHIAGEQMAIAVVAALLHRLDSGLGQDLSCAVHDAVSKNTELDVMQWVFRRVALYRQTARHASETPNGVYTISHTKDGRWYATWLGGGKSEDEAFLNWAETFGIAPLLRPQGADVVAAGRSIPGSSGSGDERAAMAETAQRLVRSFTYDAVPWEEAQARGLMWAPIRKPHENVGDRHWQARGTFGEIWHPEHKRSFVYPLSKWIGSATSWQAKQPAPHLGQHNADASVLAASRPAAPKPGKLAPSPRLSARGRPFPLQNVRILDFSWFLASAGGTRLLASLGAECIKVEWKGNPDTRMAAMAPVGGRAARERATGPLPPVSDPDMGGQFNNKNAGKRGLSLNLKDPRGLQIAKDLLRHCDVVAEGFSPGVLEKLGFGYEVMKSIKPDIIYIQQSGMGAKGAYGRVRTIGPVAGAFAGTTDMSGLPEPALPAGWGYSYLDWVGAYGFALAICAALHHRRMTGEGQHIDASQCEAGMFLTGSAVLDWSANGRPWRRIGNRSPYKPAAPHGVFPCAGKDRWIAIACFTQQEWSALAETAKRPDWLADPDYRDLQSRLLHQDRLEADVAAWTRQRDAYECMTSLQAAGVPAGVCQNAQDRVERDPQLKALEWLTEVTGTKIGTWPVIEFPVKFDRTPPYAGGVIDRGAPCYGEDNHAILKELLGLADDEIATLAADDVI